MIKDTYFCRTCIIYCMDWRLSPGKADIEKALIKNNITEPVFDRIIIGGAGKNLAAENLSEEKKFLLAQIGIAVKFHGIEKLILINHTDCLAYGGSKKHSTTELEEAFHTDELELAANAVKMNFPKLSVEKYLAELKQKEQEWEVKLLRK